MKQNTSLVWPIIYMCFGLIMFIFAAYILIDEIECEENCMPSAGASINEVCHCATGDGWKKWSNQNKQQQNIHD